MNYQLNQKGEMDNINQLPTKYVNFIATCWEMPSEVLAEIFMQTDSIEDRNFAILMECFDLYLKVMHDINNFFDSTTKKQVALFNKYYDNFLAESVKMQYLYE